MGMKLDYKQLSSHLSAMTIFSESYNDFLKKFLMEMAERVISKTKPRTPVDTGALRNAWEIWGVYGSGRDIYVEFNNEMEYASYIEYGHRIVNNGIELGWYEGRFMLKTSIEEVRQQMPARYEKEFNDFCKSHGISV